MQMFAYAVVGAILDISPTVVTVQVRREEEEGEHHVYSVVCVL